MTVLFALADGDAWARWEPLARRLAARGHVPHCWLDMPDLPARTVGACTIPVSAPEPADPHWRAVITRLGGIRQRLRTTDVGGRDLALPCGSLAERRPGGSAGQGAIDAVLGVLVRSRPIGRRTLRALAALDPDVIVGDGPGSEHWAMGEYIPAARRIGRRSVLVFPPNGELPAAVLLDPPPDVVIVWTMEQADYAMAVNGMHQDAIRRVERPGWAGASDILDGLGRLPRRAPEGPGLAALFRPAVSGVVAARRAAHAWGRWRKRGKRFTRKSASRLVQGARRRVRMAVRRHLSPTAVVLTPGRAAPTAAIDLEPARAVRESLAEVAARRGPVIVGPWLSEAGFELLYWIPFVRWAKTYAGIREDRLIVVSRGGVKPWYQDVASRYVELFKLYAPEEFRRRNADRILQQDGEKQFEPSSFDLEIRDHVLRRLGRRDVGWLHPGVMYNLFKPYWMQLAPLALVQSCTVHRRLPDIGGAPVTELPRSYIVAKFYANAGFPDTPDNRLFVSRLLMRLAEHRPVVLLHTGIGFDDHGEFDVSASPRIVVLSERLTAEDNLRQQTRVIQGADAYVGTYGGFSYVAPLAGVNAVTFYSEPSAFRYDHLALAQRVFTEVGGGRFIAASTTEVDFLDAVLVRLLVQERVAAADSGVTG